MPRAVRALTRHPSPTRRVVAVRQDDGDLGSRAEDRVDEGARVAAFGSGRLPQIFLSYRREEAGYAATWLDSLMVTEFGRNNVFTDVASIGPGDEYVDRIMAAVRLSDVVLVLIGKQWAVLPDVDGGRRLDDPADLVRLEIETALQAGCVIVPVLLDGAALPAAHSLPRSLAGLVTRQAAVLTAGNFVDEAGRLIAALRGMRLPEDRGPVPRSNPWAVWGTSVPSPQWIGPSVPVWRAVLSMDDGSGRSLDLRLGQTVVGRGKDTGFPIPDTGLSRRHMEISWDGTHATLTDLGSTNGVTVNGSPVQFCDLLDGDIIRIGHTSLVFRLVQD